MCDFDPDCTDILCADCPLLSENYQDLIDAVSDPLYRAAMLYLTDHELGLSHLWADIDPLTIEAVRYVHGERAQLDEKIRKWKEGEGG